MLRTEINLAFGCSDVPVWRSTSNDLMPYLDNRIDVVSPTGPPPTISIGTFFTEPLISFRAHTRSACARIRRPLASQAHMPKYH
jgi:hypothetical protein